MKRRGTRPRVRSISGEVESGRRDGSGQPNTYRRVVVGIPRQVKRRGRNCQAGEQARDAGSSVGANEKEDRECCVERFDWVRRGAGGTPRSKSVVLGVTHDHSHLRSVPARPWANRRIENADHPSMMKGSSGSSESYWSGSESAQIGGGSGVVFGSGLESDQTSVEPPRDGGGVGWSGMS